MSGGFFRGTSADQDTRFSNKQAKLLKSQKFAPELEHLVDITKVKMDVIKPWIAKRVTEFLDGFEDEVLINFIYGLLEGKNVNGKEVQIQITGFMEKNTGKFMKELWALLLSAQKNASGVPQQFLDAKEEETRKKKAETDRIFEEIEKRKEKEREESEQDKDRHMDDGLSNNHTEESNRRLERGSGVESRDENGSDVRNGFRRRSRERSISGSPEAKKRSPFPERRQRSLRRSITPRRRSVSVSRSPRRRSLSRSHTPYRSPSPMRHRLRSPPRRSPLPIRRRSPRVRRSPSPLHRRSRSPLRHRSPPRRRSPSPWRRRSPLSGRRRSPSPVQRRRRSFTSSSRSRSRSRFRFRSPAPRRSLSPPPRHRFQSPVKRSFYPVRHRSPARRRSHFPDGHISRSPFRRRSPLPRVRRSPSPVEKRSLSSFRKSSPVRSRSYSPASLSSSPVEMRSPRIQDSPNGSPQERNRNREPATMPHRKPITMSPQRDHSNRKHLLRNVPSVSPLEKPYEDRRLTSPHDSPGLQTGENVTLNGGQSPSGSREQRCYHVSLAISEEKHENDRDKDKELVEQKSAPALSGQKTDLSTNYQHCVGGVAKNGDNEIKRLNEKGSSQLKDVGDNSRQKLQSPSIVSESDENDKYRTEVSVKRKRRKSRRREVSSDDTSSDSEIEDRKEAKRRKKEEKKLRKEERCRKREERRQRKEEKRASKKKLKSKDADALLSDVEKNEKGNIGELRMKKHSSDKEETESNKKRLEIELREKALESLRAKKGISR